MSAAAPALTSLQPPRAVPTASRRPLTPEDAGLQDVAGPRMGDLDRDRAVAGCIRAGRCVRRPLVGVFSPQQREWIISPLIDAGLGVDRITELLFRLSFEAIVSEGRGAAAEATAMVTDQPAHVRAAWTEVICRMISLSPSNA